MKKDQIFIADEWIGERPNGSGDSPIRQVQLHCQSVTLADLLGAKFDAVFTDPPYFGNVQYAELMDFCYVWLRRLIGEGRSVFRKASTRDQNELTGNVTMERGLNRKCREAPDFVSSMENRYQIRLARSTISIERPKSLKRIEDLVKVAIQYITIGAPKESEGVIHRLAKFDTHEGLLSLQYAATENVPYAVLLYERYLGRPFAAHRDAVSELVGEVMENAIENRLRRAGVTYRKTGRAERIPGFGQAPDFCIPDEVDPAVVIEAKVTSNDGTSRIRSPVSRNWKPSSGNMWPPADPAMRLLHVSTAEAFGSDGRI